MVATARGKEGLDEAVAALGGQSRAAALPGKADDAEHQAATVKLAIEAFGSADLLVNGTGINPVYGSLMELELDAARKIVEVNCLAAIGWVRHVYEAWMRDHGGAVVNVSSVAGLRPSLGIGFYGASKAMLTHITQQLAFELAPRVRVNAVAPAVVKTQFATALYAGREEEVAQAYPMKRLGVPEDISGVVAFLLSEDAGWLTGQLVVVDGGVMLTRDRGAAEDKHEQ